MAKKREGTEGFYIDSNGVKTDKKFHQELLGKDDGPRYRYGKDAVNVKQSKRKK